MTEEDFEEIGCLLSIAYNELANQYGGENLTERLQERRGVMTSKAFYSNILYIDCNVKECKMSESDWISLEHTCLASAEKIAVMLVELLKNNGLIEGKDSYLELYVDEIYRSL